MSKCKFKKCEKEAKIGLKGYCASCYEHSAKGNQKIGVYDIAFHFNECTYHYVGRAFAQHIKREVTKHKSAIRKQEKGKDVKLKECVDKLCLEHPDLSRSEVIDKYVECNELVTHDALGGYAIKFDEDEGKYVEVTDTDEIRELYLKKYRNYIEKYFNKLGLKKGIKFEDMTKDEKEILKFINYEFLIVDNEETQKINEYKERYGDLCLNFNKVKS